MSLPQSSRHLTQPLVGVQKTFACITLYYAPRCIAFAGGVVVRRCSRIQNELTVRVNEFLNRLVQLAVVFYNAAALKILTAQVSVVRVLCNERSISAGRH